MTKNKYQGIEVERIACMNTKTEPRQSDGFEIIYVESGEIRVGLDTAKQGEMILINPKQTYIIEAITPKTEMVSFKIDIVRIWENEREESKNIANEYIKQAVEYMEQNLKDVTATEMAEYVGVSYTYFLKLFKEVTGYNFIKFIQNKRVQKSQMLLLDTKKTLNEIALEVGFSTTSHFIKVFKSYTGVTPSTYRRQVLYVKINKQD